MAGQSNSSYHDLRQPLSSIMNYAGAGVRMADNGADHHTLKHVFAQIQAQAERLSEICSVQENSSNKHDADIGE